MIKNPDFEQDYWSKTATGVYRIVHDSNRIMKWSIHYDRSYFDNMNNFNLMGSICKYLIMNEKMKYLGGNYYVEVKDHGYRIHPTKNIILRLRDLHLLLELSIKFKMRL